MKLRTILFYVHLTAGSVAGIVVLIMSFTGFLLAYERQINNWVNREYRSAPPVPGSERLPVGSLLAGVCKSQPSTPTNVILHSQPELPVEIAFGADRSVYFNSYTGDAIGSPSVKARSFFRSAENWHRWLGVPDQNRAVGRAVTGICNMAFFVLVSTGLFLWRPRSWTWARFKAAITWRWNRMPGRVREWNWHTVTGFWCAVPLLVIVSCGVVMSYPWATNLVYRMTGNAPPPPAQAAPAAAAPAAGAARTQADGSRANGANRACGNWDMDRMGNLWERAEQQVSGWQTITLRVPARLGTSAVFAIDTGNGGRPDKRSQLTLDWQTGSVMRWEPFSSYNSGRRLRTWIRFTHTGEDGGIFGETIAALAVTGTMVLGITGLVMALKRFRARFFPAVRSRSAVHSRP